MQLIVLYHKMQYEAVINSFNVSLQVEKYYRDQEKDSSERGSRESSSSSS